MPLPVCMPVRLALALISLPVCLNVRLPLVRMSLPVCMPVCTPPPCSGCRCLFGSIRFMCRWLSVCLSASLISVLFATHLSLSPDSKHFSQCPTTDVSVFNGCLILFLLVCLSACLSASSSDRQSVRQCVCRPASLCLPLTTLHVSLCRAGYLLSSTILSHLIPSSYFNPSCNQSFPSHIISSNLILSYPISLCLNSFHPFLVVYRIAHLEWVRMGCSGLEWVAIGWNGLLCVGMGCSGLEWVAPGWNWLPLVGMSCSGLE